MADTERTTVDGRRQCLQRMRGRYLAADDRQLQALGSYEGVRIVSPSQRGGPIGPGRTAILTASGTERADRAPGAESRSTWARGHSRCQAAGATTKKLKHDRPTRPLAPGPF